MRTRPFLLLLLKVCLKVKNIFPLQLYSSRSALQTTVSKNDPVVVRAMEAMLLKGFDFDPRMERYHAAVKRVGVKANLNV